MVEEKTPLAPITESDKKPLVSSSEKLRISDDTSSSVTDRKNVTQDIPKDENLQLLVDVPDDQTKLTSNDLAEEQKNINQNKILTEKKTDNNQKEQIVAKQINSSNNNNTKIEKEKNSKDELNVSSILAKEENQSKVNQLASNQSTKKKNWTSPELLANNSIDSQNKLAVDVNEHQSVFNKDFTKAKDNIRSFSNSLSDDEDTDLFQQRTSDKSKRTQEIIIPGKIEKNVPLKTGTVDVSAMMIKRNGDFVETSQANKTHALRVNFKMYKNDNIAPGNKEIFIVIQNPKRKVINEKGKFELRTGVEIPYSDETVAYYDGNNINISILSDKFVQKFVKGTYIVKIFIERYLTGQTLLILS